MIQLLPVEASDVEKVIALYCDETNHHMMILDYQLPLNEYNMKEPFETFLKDPTQKHFKVTFEHSYVGFAQIYDISSVNRKCKIGIILEPHSQNKGLGHQIIRKMIELCFLDLNLRKIEAEIIQFNQRSIKLFESAGFIQEGSLREAVYKKGEYHAVHVYGLLKKEWQITAL